MADSHLLIAAAASAFTCSAYLQLSIPPDVPLIIFIGFATFSTYNIQNRMGLSRSVGEKNFSTSWRPLIYAGVGVTGMAACLIRMGNSMILTWFILPGTLSLLYATPMFTFRRVRITLREVPGLKIYLILFVWLWVSAFIPYVSDVSAGTSFTPDFVLFCMQRALFLFALLIPFDIRDLKTDYAFQKTIPQMIGLRRSLWLAAVALSAYGLIAGFRWWDGSIDFSTFAGLILTGIITSALIMRTHEDRSALYFTFLIDSMLWVQFVLIWLLKKF